MLFMSGDRATMTFQWPIGVEDSPRAKEAISFSNVVLRLNNRLEVELLKLF